MTDIVKIEYEQPVLPAITATEIARALVVDSQDMYDFANEQLGEIKARYRALDERRKAIVDPINKAKQAVQDLFNPVLADLDGAESAYKSAMLNYQRGQDRLRLEEQARLDREAREQRERLEKQAAKAEKKGDAETAAVLAQTAAVMTAPIATSTYVQAKGASVVRTWKARVTDKAALLKSIVENPMFLHLIEIDDAALNKLAKAMQGQLPIAGVETYQVETLARRAA